MNSSQEISQVTSRPQVHMPPEVLLAAPDAANPRPEPPQYDDKDDEATLRASTVNLEQLDKDYSYPDGGLRAWLVVLGCFLMAASGMAFGLVWGVLQDYYHTNMFPETSLSILSLICGLNNFAMTGSSYLSGGLGDRYGYKRMIGLSAFLTFLCLFGSAFATKVYQLFLLQGVFLGLAQGLSMPLYIALPSRWFDKKRGLASGIAVAGSSFGGGVHSLYVRRLLTSLGYRKTMIIFSCILGLLYSIALLLMKERPLPPSIQNAKRRWLPRKLNGQFWSVGFSVFFGIFGYLPPYFLSSTYTRYRVPSIPSGSLLIAVPLVTMNFSGFVGRIVSGLIADRFGPINTFFASFFFGGLLQMIGWTFARSYSAIIVFSVLNGLIGCWFLGLLPVVCAELFGVEGLSTITGFMILMNSPGQFTGPSIASAILSASGNNWTVVTIYSGATAMIGAFIILYARFSHEPRLWARC